MDSHTIRIICEKSPITEDSVKNRHVSVLRGLDGSKYDLIKEHWSALQRRTQADTSGSPSFRDNDIFVRFLPAKIRSHIFSALPFRLIKLPEMCLQERSAVADYVIKHRLNKENLQRITSRYTSARFWKKTIETDELISAVVEDVTRFATLSHTWGPDEQNLEDFRQGRKTDSLGYRKLVEFCKIAHEQHGLEFAWADTVCIDKSSSSELDESIRSMFTWYRESFICIIYLAETETLLHLPFDRWFTRGWTLQELLAPFQIKFYNKNWQPLTDLCNDKLDPDETRIRNLEYTYPLQLRLLQDGISAATGIPMSQIRHFRPGLQDPPLPQRFKWIASRITTRPEDMAYSMMGVLNVSFPIAYGEGGERAFFRLFQAALEVSWSPGWFFWEGKPISLHIHPSRIIPSSPASYLSWDASYREYSHRKEPISFTNLGLAMKVLVVPVKVDFTGSEPNRHTLRDADITCLLSDYIIEAVGLPFSPGIPGYPRRYALGILDENPTSVDRLPKIMKAILLSRIHYYSHEAGKWVARGDWGVWETMRVLTIELKTEHCTWLNSWFRVEIPGQWWDVEKEDMVPKIVFRDLHL